jgi:DNA-directed RNA polymerase subunit RPC12/RpoP
MKMICADCGTTFDETEENYICPNCNYNNDPDYEDDFYEEDEEEDDDGSEELQCSSCGTWFTVYDFEEKRCPQCGFMNDYYDDFEEEIEEEI